MWLSFQCAVLALLGVSAFFGSSGSVSSGPDNETETPRRVEDGSEEATSSEEEGVEPCWNWRGFHNLSRCLEICGQTTALRLPGLAKRDSASSVYYKVIHLGETEYQIDGARLRVRVPFAKSRRTFRRGEYVLSAGGAAFACHPLSEGFTRCVKWVLGPEEYSVFDNGTLLSKVHQETYDFNEYFVLHDNSSVTCSIEGSDTDDRDNHALPLLSGTVTSICLAILLILVT